MLPLHARTSLVGLFVLAAGCRDTTSSRVTDEAPVVLPRGIAQLALVQDVSLSPGAPVAPTLPTVASVLGGDAFRVDLDGVRRSMVGAFQPGKVRVTLRVRVRSLLDRAVLVTPTFPIPPAAGNKVYLFIAQVAAVDVPGTVSTTGSNEVLITVPGRGTVAPSPEWDGPWYDYLRSGPCNGAGSTCARYQVFAAPVEARGVTEWESVGFDVDPTVRHLRMRLVLAADLKNAE